MLDQNTYIVPESISQYLSDYFYFESLSFKVPEILALKVAHLILRKKVIQKSKIPKNGVSTGARSLTSA